ncbi:hypothetical protein HU200_060950 [Digitaria exilis]|uniref:Uncharacterized protein n=1 Tax=Digitaria exilis TaxID=1010633 RepID=A0A835ADL2_9POAL|nr:hypothetical protein HU200_060950 [Digitaria exilis]
MMWCSMQRNHHTSASRHPAGKMQGYGVTDGLLPTRSSLSPGVDLLSSCKHPICFPLLFFPHAQM